MVDYPTGNSKTRGSFLIGLTLAEIAFLLFFAILLFVGDQKEKLYKYKTEYQTLLENNERLKMELKSLNDFKKLVEQYHKKNASQNRQSRNDFRDDFTKLVRDARQVEQVKRKLKDLKIEHSLLREENKRLESKAQNIKAQLDHVHQQLGPHGFDPPPCWLNSETGEIEYIYKVTIRENGLVVNSVWPDYRKKDVMQNPEFSEWPDRLISLSEFRKHASPILSWCKKQDPECRHYVRIYDESISKEAFKRYLLGVEDYFYKWLSRE